MVVVSEDVCNETTSACCSGFFRNLETNECENCKPGYTGPNCTVRCYYPSYGNKCQGICNCSADICDMSWGCRTLTTITSGGNQSHFMDLSVPSPEQKSSPFPIGNKFTSAAVQIMIPISIAVFFPNW
uniref:Uncharacterized protein n=1 Tax=Magallana gigas TaxID=29159 RepID=A0A8W8JMJ7_MAGGI